MIGFFFQSLFLVAVLVSSSSVACAAQLGVTTVGDTLDALVERVVQTVGKGADSGAGRRLVVGAPAMIVLGNARVTHAGSLNLTVPEFAARVPGALQKLEQMVTAVERGDQEAPAAVSRAGESLGFTGDMPRLAAVRPLFFAPGRKNYLLSLHFTGTFGPTAATAPHPCLLVEAKRYEAETVTLGELVFPVPVEELTAESGSDYSVKKVVLVVPYAAGKEARFPVLIGRLPHGPGRVAVLHKEIVSKTEVRHLVTRKWSQTAAAADRQGDFCSDEQPGWRVRPESVKLVVLKSQGGAETWSTVFVSSNPRVCYHVETVHNRHGRSGRIDFRFEYDVERTTDREEWVEEPVDLRWGDSRSFPYAEGGWKVMVETFDGRRLELTAATGGERLVRLVSGGGFLTISAPPPQKVDWP